MKEKAQMKDWKVRTEEISQKEVQNDRDGKIKRENTRKLENQFGRYNI